MSLKDKWKVDQIAPGHCTGEPAFLALKQAFGERYLYAGLGTVLELGATSPSSTAQTATPANASIGSQIPGKKKPVKSTFYGLPS
jgi:7,8-dihydropterin-6-yl-methyl-4-(beta-D-ribofuranosyl)aminobenzene 5'-phosphate synthase